MVRRSTTQVLPIIALFLLLAAAPLLAEEGGNHGWLGVSVGRAEADPATGGATGGIAITGIVADSPAAEAGLRAQDRILTLEGAPVSSFEEFRSKLRGMGPGSWVEFTVERDGEEMDFDAKLSGPPDTSGGIRLRIGWIGIDAIDLPGKLRVHFGAPAQAGVMVSDVVTGSPAESAGLRVGDVVYDVNGNSMKSAGMFRSSVARGGVGNTLEMTLVRSSAKIVVEATVSVEPPKDDPDKT